MREFDEARRKFGVAGSEGGIDLARDIGGPGPRHRAQLTVAQRRRIASCDKNLATIACMREDDSERRRTANAKRDPTCKTHDCQINSTRSKPATDTM